MMKLLRTMLCSGVFSLGLLSTANAELEAREGGMVYDTFLNITWLADANYAKTSGYDSDGRMNWSEANAWAAGLSYGGHDNWRLPTALNQDGGPCGGPCTSNEMGHMFYNNLGASWHNSILSGTNTANLALFANLQSDVYWTGTVSSLLDSYAWVFVAYDGNSFIYGKDDELYAWAVHPGDVAAIPEPETYAMLIAGLGLLGFMARRRKESIV